MILISENDPRLKLNSEPFVFDSTEEALSKRKQLVDDMITTMSACRGIGLAAPQVGINKALFVMEAEGSIFPCFNPRISEISTETHLDVEGCLSFPDLWMKVTRPIWVTGEFQDLNGNTITRKFDGLAARCYIHELEHLNGICFTDVVSNLVLNRAKEQRKKLKQRRK